MINWKVRFKNKAFWATIIPALLVLIQLVAGVFGFTIDLGDLGNKLLAILDVVFLILAAIGIVTDHTTEGVGDSRQALTYTEPKAR
ncbi:MAG: phage holin [Ruminococcus sp.]|nr:phage holin [Ruminococcus sp.]